VCYTCFVQGKNSAGPEINFAGKSLAVFVQYYNQNIPAQFPRASIEELERFKADHIELFKEGDEWTIDKHRKKLMDWLTARRTLE